MSRWLLGKHALNFEKENIQKNKLRNLQSVALYKMNSDYMAYIAKSIGNYQYIHISI
jgi:hypothetical protein